MLEGLFEMYLFQLFYCSMRMLPCWSIIDALAFGDFMFFVLPDIVENFFSPNIDFFLVFNF